MAEINRDITLYYPRRFTRNGWCLEAPQFKANVGESAAPRHEDPTGDDIWATNCGGPAQPGTSADEVVIAVGLPLAVVNDKPSLVYRIKR